MSPDTPPPDLEECLSAVRQAINDVSLVISFMAELQHRANRLKPFILNELRELQPKIDAAIALLSADQQGGSR
jgi:hypothetical protein